mmetsp:Transcript_17697/g.24292  ORF Transcript_17697/g.24292 Transcript_17697/m.24292 type:complete len:112 (+) Transcript_17697:450-785(+)
MLANDRFTHQIVLVARVDEDCLEDRMVSNALEITEVLEEERIGEDADVCVIIEGIGIVRTVPEQQERILSSTQPSIAPEQQVKELKAAKEPESAALEASSSEAVKIDPMIC